MLQDSDDKRSGVTVTFPEVVGEDGDYSVITLRKSSISRQLDSLVETVGQHCDNIRDAVQSLVETYCHAFRVDFQLSSKSDLPSSECNNSLSIIFNLCN